MEFLQYVSSFQPSQFVLPTTSTDHLVYLGDAGPGAVFRTNQRAGTPDTSANHRAASADGTIHRKGESAWRRKRRVVPGTGSIRVSASGSDACTSGSGADTITIGVAGERAEIESVDTDSDVVVVDDASVDVAQQLTVATRSKSVGSVHTGRTGRPDTRTANGRRPNRTTPATRPGVKSDAGARTDDIQVMDPRGTSCGKVQKRSHPDNNGRTDDVILIEDPKTDPVSPARKRTRVVDENEDGTQGKERLPRMVQKFNGNQGTSVPATEQRQECVILSGSEGAKGTSTTAKGLSDSALRIPDLNALRQKLKRSLEWFGKRSATSSTEPAQKTQTEVPAQVIDATGSSETPDVIGWMPVTNFVDLTECLTAEEYGGKARKYGEKRKEPRGKKTESEEVEIGRIIVLDEDTTEEEGEPEHTVKDIAKQEEEEVRSKADEIKIQDDAQNTTDTRDTNDDHHSIGVDLESEEKSENYAAESFDSVDTPLVTLNSSYATCDTSRDPLDASPAMIQVDVSQENGEPFHTTATVEPVLLGAETGSPDSAAVAELAPPHGANIQVNNSGGAIPETNGSEKAIAELGQETNNCGDTFVEQGSDMRGCGGSAINEGQDGSESCNGGDVTVRLDSKMGETGGDATLSGEVSSLVSAVEQGPDTSKACSTSVGPETNNSNGSATKRTPEPSSFSDAGEFCPETDCLSSVLEPGPDLTDPGESLMGPETRRLGDAATIEPETSHPDNATTIVTGPDTGNLGNTAQELWPGTSDAGNAAVDLGRDAAQSRPDRGRNGDLPAEEPGSEQRAEGAESSASPEEVADETGEAGQNSNNSGTNGSRGKDSCSSSSNNSRDSSFISNNEDTGNNASISRSPRNTETPEPQVDTRGQGNTCVQLDACDHLDTCLDGGDNEKQPWTFHEKRSLVPLDVDLNPGPLGAHECYIMCQWCGLAFSLESFREHFRDEHADVSDTEEVAQCTTCYLVFENDAVLKRHSQSCEAGKLSTAIGDKIWDSANLQCEKCHVLFNSDTELLSHQFDTFCLRCVTQVSCAASLKQHRRFQCVDDAKICKFCQKGLLSSNHRKSCGFKRELHALVKESDTCSVPCDACTFNFRSREARRQHRTPVKCSSRNCRLTFRCRTQFLVHDHVTDDVFLDCACSNCGTQFTSVKTLVWHRRNCVELDPPSTDHESETSHTTSSESTSSAHASTSTESISSCASASAVANKRDKKSAKKKWEKAAVATETGWQDAAGFVTVSVLQELREQFSGPNSDFAAELRKVFPLSYGRKKYSCLPTLTKQVERALNSGKRNKRFVPRVKRRVMNEYLEWSALDRK